MGIQHFCVFHRVGLFSCVLVLHLICVVFVLVSHFDLISCHDFVFAVFALLVVLEPGPALRCGPAVGLLCVQHFLFIICVATFGSRVYFCKPFYFLPPSSPKSPPVGLCC